MNQLRRKCLPQRQGSRRFPYGLLLPFFPANLFILLLFILLLFTGRSNANDADSTDPLKLLPPHIVLYLSDTAASHAANLRAESSASSIQMGRAETPQSAGMTFTHAVASASGVELGRRALESGNVLDDSESERSMADHLKLKGYRLLTIGDKVSAGQQSGEFQFEVVGDSLETFDLRNSPKLLSEFLKREVQHDHRPICLLIRDSNDSTATNSVASQESNALGNTFIAVRSSLPRNQTIFISTAICGRGLNHGSDAAAKCPLNIPLTVVWDQRIPAGRTIEALVSAVDILPTIVELTGATPPSEIDGRSFASILRGESLEHRDVAFSVIHRPDDKDRYCVHDSRFLYITDYQLTTKAELFDLLSDPKRERNLVDDPSMAQRCREMRDQLNLWLERHGKSALPVAGAN